MRRRRLIEVVGMPLARLIGTVAVVRVRGRVRVKVRVRVRVRIRVRDRVRAVSYTHLRAHET